MSDLQFHDEIDLSASPPFSSVKLRFKFTPPTSGCIVYGYTDAESITPMQIRGSGDYDLPLISPKIYIRRDFDLLAIEVSTLGWFDGSPLPGGGAPLN